MKPFLTAVCSLSLLLCLYQPLQAQSDSTATASEAPFTTEKPLTIDLEEEKEEEEVVKKKRKKNVFFDLKTRKGFTKSGYGDAEKIQLFHLLKEWEEPDPYVRDIHWFEYKSRTVKVGGSPTPDKGMLLHGPYRLMQDGQLLEEGIFYKGAKHGRWTTYRKMYDYYVLDHKTKYFKGWPKESKVNYYANKSRGLQEVIPVEYGKKEGNYFYFFEDGQLAVKGEFRYDYKVGQWTEYYPGPKQRRKRVVMYPTTPWERNSDPFIMQEWDKEGKLIYEASKKK